MSDYKWLAIGFAAGLGLFLAASEGRSQQPQNGVPCRYVPNGANITIACANGYYRTVTPDGEEFSGVGLDDPSASARGSGIVINPATGGVDLTRGQTVTPPTQVLPQLAPYQAETYGFTPRQD